MLAMYIGTEVINEVLTWVKGRWGNISTLAEI